MGLAQWMAKNAGVSWTDILGDSPAGRDAGAGNESESRNEPLSRRKLLLGALMASGLSQREAQAAPTTSATRWLINRLTYGWTQAEQARADQLGYHGYLEYQLNHTAIDDSALTQRLNPYLYLRLTPAQLISISMPSYIIHQVVESTFLRAVHSARQLYQKLVEFWADHFHISITNELNAWLRYVDVRDVIMPHALGKFPDMLNASARSVPMLLYLNNQENAWWSINENYGRELLELHTLGVDGGYTQQDVMEVARCFTGWGAVGTEGAPNPNWLTFAYYPHKHDNGPKTVLGFDIPAGGGMNDGQIVLDILANHASTAQFVSKKLCRRFYDYDPPVSLVNSVAQTYTATGGDIKAMVRTLFNSVDPQTAPLKLKRPFNLFTSAFRATGADIVDFPNGQTSFLRSLMADCGHQPFHWGPPDGFPESLDFWANLLTPRWAFASNLGTVGMSQVNFNVSSFMSGAFTAGAMVDRIESRVFPFGLSATDKALLRDYLAVDPGSVSLQRETVGLSLASPSFQWE